MSRRLFLFFAFCGLAAAQSDALAPLARRFMETGSTPAREALAQFAATAPASEASLAHLVLGIGDYQDKRYPSAAEELAAALEKPSDLADYAVYYRALALAANNNHAGAAWLLADFEKRFPSSPLLVPALTQRVDSLSQSGHAKEALELLGSLPSLAGAAKPVSTAASGMLEAHVAERASDLARAAQAYQRVYYEFPASAEQAEALAAMNTLRAKLGSRYPEPSPALRLTRADRLVAAQKYLAARTEYRLLSLRLKGLPREQASVRIGVCDYHLKADLRGYRWLTTLKITQPEAAAERLYYIAALARRLKKQDQFLAEVEELGRTHRSSPWYEEALFSAGNYFLVENTSDQYVKYYRALYENFRQGKYSALAHWKVAWQSYLDRKPEARQLFEEHARLYPSSAQITAAVYWMGRTGESAGDEATARACYQYLARSCPNYYYGLLARDRLPKLAAPSTPTPPAVTQLLATVPAPPGPPSTAASQEWNACARRARVLDRVGLADLAQRELRFRAESSPWSYLAAMELAQQAGDRGNFHQAIRYLKRYTPGYLGYTIDAMPRRYWELLFPMPWREAIRTYSKERDLDPYLVAALIRQESEFNPSAISHKSARGLMQIMPSTGRKLGRNLGIGPVPTSRLYVPETSLKLGTLQLRRVLDQYEGRLEPALAGYNAGEHRADRWLGWRPMQDPAEFVESIPFTETRGYVQAVLRNAEIYRKLYGE